MYRYRTNGIGCFSLLSNSQDAPRRFKYANTGSGTKAICTSKWQYWSLCENSHDTRQSQRPTTQSITHVICSAMKTHGLHESTCHSHPPHTPSLSPQIRSPYPAFQINIKNEMPYTESPGPEDPVPKGPVCHDTTQTHNSLLVKHTHTLTCWFTRLANDQCRHTHK